MDSDYRVERRGRKDQGGRNWDVSPTPLSESLSERHPAVASEQENRLFGVDGRLRA